MRISEVRNAQQFQDLCQSLLVAEDKNTQIVRDSSGDDGMEVDSKANQFQKTHQLRTAVADFVGRKEEINVLIDGLSGRGQVGISGVNGMGGIGKTELALVTANQIKEMFPDGQIFFDMEGYERETASSL